MRQRKVLYHKYLCALAGPAWPRPCGRLPSAREPLGLCWLLLSEGKKVLKLHFQHKYLQLRKGRLFPEHIPWFLSNTSAPSNTVWVMEPSWLRVQRWKCRAARTARAVFPVISLLTDQVCLFHRFWSSSQPSRKKNLLPKNQHDVVNLPLSPDSTNNRKVPAESERTKVWVWVQGCLVT